MLNSGPVVQPGPVAKNATPRPTSVLSVLPWFICTVVIYTLQRVDIYYCHDGNSLS